MITTTGLDRAPSLHPTPPAADRGRPAPISTAPPVGAGRLGLAVLLAGTCLIVLDFFIVNVALPSMQRELGTGTSGLEWIVAGYGLSFAVLLLAAGRLGDRVGRRRLYATGVAVFTAASLLCGLAPNTPTLLVGRVVQGVGGAMISPTMLALIGTMYAGPALARAIGCYATVMGFAAASGQLVGGVLVRADIAGLGWRAVFLINVPVGAFVLATVRRAVPESRAAVAAPVDRLGLVLAGAALTALLLPLVQGRQLGWPAWSWACLALSPVLFMSFVQRQRHLAAAGASPVLQPAWFRERAFRSGMLTQLGFWTGQASYFLVLALYLQLGRGLSALQSGLVFSILAAAYLVTSSRAAQLTARHGRRVVITGAAMLAAGHLVSLLAVVTVHGAILALAPGLMLTGGGMGLCLAPITATVMAGVDAQRAGAVTGLLSTLQQVGNAIGVAVIGVVFFGAAGEGYAHAFAVSSAVLAGLLAAVAGLARLLPRRVA